ncbi:class I SAM-dependent methyltransferase [Paracoccus sp. PAR01]|nr:class I SAM-dependent methyltransferase [Paracoccus sp. PAR01]
MGKRSSFERRERDFYPTPREAVAPLIPHLPSVTFYAEPCAGDGALIWHLDDAGAMCVHASDIDPKHDGVDTLDALQIGPRHIESANCFITNPPWSRDILHPLIAHLSDMLPTWLLFDADWMHTKQAAPYLPRLRKIVSVGRVKWIPDSKMTGKDNCCWYLFDAAASDSAEFVGRVA